MTEAYVVRDPQGRVIGMSAYDHHSALEDAGINERHNTDICWNDVFMELARAFEAQGCAVLYGYTLKREQVAL
jgi:hypothetical protein